MYEIVKDFPNEFIFEEGYPCISIYQNTHRRSPDNIEDGTAFKNSLFKIEDNLKKRFEGFPAHMVNVKFLYRREGMQRGAGSLVHVFFVRRPNDEA